MAEIKTAKGEVILLDDQDFAVFGHLTWCVDRYACKNAQRADGSRYTARLHRLIAGLDLGDKRQVDHINGNKLDNRRENLRICTPGQNAANCVARARNKSGLKGVSWAKRENKWQAQIQANRKPVHLGLFTDKEAAYAAYCKAAAKLHGEFANFG